MLLNDILEKHSPAATPHGEWSWVLELPIAPENLLFSASLVCSDAELHATVYKKESPSSWSDEVFGATWALTEGAWMFKQGHLDGKALAEAASVQNFGRYVEAMGVEPVFQAPMVMHAPRRKMGGR